jgi:hypothetical protein
VGVHSLYKGVDNHWRQTPEYKELLDSGVFCFPYVG